QQYNAAGTYNITVASTTGGCDTAATLNLIIKAITTSTTDVTICSNHLPYNWNRTNYNAAGTYTFTTTNAAGCDSVATLNLTVNNLLTKPDNITIRPAHHTYPCHSQQYNAAGTYNTTVPSTTGGCDTA